MRIVLAGTSEQTQDFSHFNAPKRSFRLCNVPLFATHIRDEDRIQAPAASPLRGFSFTLSAYVTSNYLRIFRIFILRIRLLRIY